jgi:hydrogenase maturation protease
LLDATLVGESSAAPAQGAAGDRVLVLGVGNLLMGDEGVGIHVLRELERAAAIPGATLLDGGTGGINLLEAISAVPVVIMIDATCDGRPAGTITCLRPSRVADLPHGLSAHDFGLKDLFAAAALLDRFPEIHLFTISVETITPMCLELSPAVAQAMPDVVRAVQALANRLLAATMVPE